jgi:hypothetical protein
MVLLWFMRYHSLDFFDYDSVDAAVAGAVYMEDSCNGAAEMIEVFENGSSIRIITGTELDRLQRTYARERELARESTVNIPHPWHVQVQAPEEFKSEWVTQEVCKTQAEAIADAHKLAESLGEIRVRVMIDE